MNDDTHRWADEKLAGLDLRQKIGQLFVFGLNGPIETPDIIELIRDYHVGGLRIAQKFHGGSSGMSAPHSSVAAPPDVNTFDRPASLKDRPVHCTPWEYTCMLNRLRDHALERRGGVPLHFVFDQEGEGADLIFRAHLFPSAMGLARATPDGSLAYDVARAVSRQARAMGCNMIHSPVVDVNSTAENPEIGPRAYGEDAETVTMQALAALRGFSDGGIIATGKHFPGRGDSTEDAHFGLPVIDLEQEALMHNHLAPYRALIKAGLPAVMAGFTAYPSLDPSGVPAATSPLIIGELLRGELGFRGVVTTDNITMRGLLDFYDAEEAVIRSLLAGCDLILCRLQTPISKRLIQSVRVAIKDGRLSERRIDESVRRILAMRHAMGLHVDGGKVDPEQADLFEDTEICRTAIRAATRATEILRDSRGVLPLCRDARVLLVEQAHHFHTFISTIYSHPGLLWEEMQRYSHNVSVVAINEKYTEEDEQRILVRLASADYDVVVATSYYNYRSGASMIPLLDKLRGRGVPHVVVANTPYPRFGPPEWVACAVVCYCPSGRENIAAVAKTLFEGPV